jgi:hypothetical protein
LAGGGISVKAIDQLSIFIMSPSSSASDTFYIELSEIGILQFSSVDCEEKSSADRIHATQKVGRTITPAPGVRNPFLFLA